MVGAALIVERWRRSLPRSARSSDLDSIVQEVEARTGAYPLWRRPENLRSIPALGLDIAHELVAVAALVLDRGGGGGKPKISLWLASVASPARPGALDGAHELKLVAERRLAAIATAARGLAAPPCSRRRRGRRSTAARRPDVA